MSRCPTAQDFASRLFDEPQIMVDEMTALGLKHIMFQAPLKQHANSRSGDSKARFYDILWFFFAFSMAFLWILMDFV